MQAEIPLLDISQLESDISARVNERSLNLLYLKSCESTNKVCRQLGQHYSIVLAEQQSAGRGRRGNAWYSPSAQNIYCSIGLIKTIQAGALGLLSLQVGVSIARVLREQGFMQVTLKWPNDILLEGKKLGGILIETRQVSGNQFYLTIGFGLNVNLQEADFVHINQPATSLNRAAGESIHRQVLLAELIGRIINHIMEFELHMTDALVVAFNQLDSLLGQPVLVKTGTLEIPGIHRGINQNGQIQVQTEQGIECFSAAEISLRTSEHVTHR